MLWRQKLHIPNPKSVIWHNWVATLTLTLQHLDNIQHVAIVTGEKCQLHIKEKLYMSWVFFFLSSFSLVSFHGDNRIYLQPFTDILLKFDHQKNQEKEWPLIYRRKQIDKYLIVFTLMPSRRVNVRVKCIISLIVVLITFSSKSQCSKCCEIYFWYCEFLDYPEL